MADEPVGDLDRPRRVPARVPAAPAQGPRDARPAGRAPGSSTTSPPPPPASRSWSRSGRSGSWPSPTGKVKKGREYDLVIVDAPATGHGVGFLQTPRTFAGIARVGPDPLAGPGARPLHHRPRDHRASRSSPCPRRCRSTSRPPCERQLDRRGRDRGRPRLHERDVPRALRRRTRPSELEQALDGRRRRRPRPRSAPRSPSTAARARSASSSSGWRGRSRTPVKTLPFIFKPRARRSGPRAARAELALMASVAEILEGKRVCICAGSGGVGQDDHLGGARRRAGRPRPEGRRADDRPRQAPGRLARAGGARQRAARRWTRSCSRARASRCGASCGR